MINELDQGFRLYQYTIFKILSSTMNSDELISYRQIKYVYFINKILKLICHCRASLNRKRMSLYHILYHQSYNR